MGFKQLPLRSILLFSLAGVMLLATVIGHLSHGHPAPQMVATPPATSGFLAIPAVSSDTVASAPIAKDNPNDAMDDDLQSIKEMKEQMDNDRLQQKRIKMLKMQLEQTNLQLEQEKALSEINQLKKDNTGIVDEANDQSMDKYPEVKVVYIGGSNQQKEAILSINGINYSVKEKNRPVKNMEVVSISNSSVMVHFDLPQALNTTIDYRPE